MIFTLDKKWIEEANKRRVRRTIIEGILSATLIVSAVITGNTIVCILAAIVVVIFALDVYVSPKKGKQHSDAYSVEVTDIGLVIRIFNHQPICLKWNNVEIHSRLKIKDKLESITLLDKSGIGKVVLQGLENIERLDSLIKEKISDL